MCGLDKEKENPHLHFGVNVFSFYPGHPVLSPEQMHGITKNLQNRQFGQGLIFLSPHAILMSVVKSSKTKVL